MAAKTRPFWRVEVGRDVGYAPAFGKPENGRCGDRRGLLGIFLRGFGLGSLLSQPGAVGFAGDFQDDGSLD